MRSKLDLTSKTKVTATMMLCTSPYLQQLCVAGRSVVASSPAQRCFLIFHLCTRQYPAFPLVLEVCSSWSSGGHIPLHFVNRGQTYRPAVQSQFRYMRFKLNSYTYRLNYLYSLIDIVTLRRPIRSRIDAVDLMNPFTVAHLKIRYNQDKICRKEGE